MTCYGFVQAGGGSTRFGTDKALVKLAGKTVLQRTADLLAAVCDEVSIVAPPHKYENLPWPILADRWPGEGPLGGILTALLHANERSSSLEPRVAVHGSCSLVTSCDMPFLTQEFLRFLTHRSSSSNAQVVVPQSESGLEPLCACCRVAAESNLHLEEVVQTLLALPGVTRTKTEISLNQRVSYRILPLVKQLRMSHGRTQDS